MTKRSFFLLTLTGGAWLGVLMMLFYAGDASMGWAYLCTAMLVVSLTFDAL